MKKSIFIVFVLCVMSFGPTTYAQLNAADSVNLNVQMTPENPKPDESIYVSLTSYSTDINSSKIIWKVDGVVVKSGIGERNLTFKAGAMGVPKVLDISVVSPDGQLVQKNYTILPSSVDLIWESTGFTMPLYKGKTLFAHQDTINFIAIPHLTGSNGQEINPKNLVYKWKKNGSVQETDSGYGKNVYTTTGSVISRALDVEVEITSTDNSTSGYARIVVSPVEPSVLFYEKHPLYGLQLQKVLNGDVLLNKPEINVVAMPLFFGTSDAYAPELSYTWGVNDTTTEGSSRTTQVFRQKEGVTGTANISLRIENSRKILQYVTSNFNLVFGKTETQINTF